MCSARALFLGTGVGQKTAFTKRFFFRFVKMVSGRLFAPKREAFPQLPNLVNVFWLLRWAKLFGPRRAGFQAISLHLRRALGDSSKKHATAGRGGAANKLGRFFF